MKATRQRTSPFVLLLLAAAVLLAAAPAVTAQEPTADEIVAKHLESIGPAASRSSIKNMVVIMDCTAVLQGKIKGVADGGLVIVSEPSKVLIGMKFGSPEYPQEKFGYDGRRLTVGYLRPGQRSPLGGFLLTQDTIFKEGLPGGVLSVAWPLLNLTERQSKLKLEGTAKVGGRKAYKLGYQPRKGADLTITLFFDAENFRHLRTEYEKTVAAGLGTGGINSSAAQRGARVKITEEFSDFRSEGKLTLPQTYVLNLHSDTGSGTDTSKWTAKLKQFAVNQELSNDMFNAESGQ